VQFAQTMSAALTDNDGSPTPNCHKPELPLNDGHVERLGRRALLPSLRADRNGQCFRRRGVASQGRQSVERFRRGGTASRSRARYSMRDLRQLGIEVVPASAMVYVRLFARPTCVGRPLMRLDGGGWSKSRTARNECAASVRVAAARLVPGDARCAPEFNRAEPPRAGPTASGMMRCQCQRHLNH
jgi:hypothetical protein